MKLEQKHIAPYRPYGLRFVMTCDWTEDFEFENWGGKEQDYKEGAIWTFAGDVDSDLLLPIGDGDLSWVFRKGSTYISCEPMNGIKPILRPLSDLTKEIEHNGEKINLMHKWNDEYSIGDYFILGDGGEFKPMYDIEDWPYGMIQDMCKYHFDFNGGIKDGWAIDINTL